MLPKEDRIKICERLDHGAIKKIASACGKSSNTVTRWFNGTVEDSPEVEKAALDYFEEMLNRKKEYIKSAKSMIKQFDSIETEVES